MEIAGLLWPGEDHKTETTISRGLDSVANRHDLRSYPTDQAFLEHWFKKEKELDRAPSVSRTKRRRTSQRRDLASGGRRSFSASPPSPSHLNDPSVGSLLCRLQSPICRGRMKGAT